MRNRSMVQIVSLALLGAVAGAAMAADGKTGDQPVPPVEVSTGGTAQVAFFDPITRRLRAPTPAEASDFARKLAAQRALQAERPAFNSSRPRNEAESQRTARIVRVNGYTMTTVDTPETEFSHLVGEVNDDGKLVMSHSGGSVGSREVTK